MADRESLVGSAEINSRNHAARSARWTPTLVLSAFSCVVGSSFQFGYSTGVLNAPEAVFKSFFNATYASRTTNNGDYMPEGLLLTLWSVTVSIFCVGGMVGGFSGGFLATKLGRKTTLLLNNVTMVIATCLMSTCKVAGSYEILIAGRFFVGVHSGVSTVVASLYLSETAPLALKGAAGTLNQLAIVIGILVAQVLGLPQLLGDIDKIYILLLVPLGPALLQVVLLPFCSESPAWLLIYRGNTAAAKQALLFLRQVTDVDDEVAALERELREKTAANLVTLKDFFVIRHLRKPLVIAVVMQLSQQLSGINAVLYYSTSIFESVNLSSDDAQHATLGIGAVMVAMTFVSVLLIDRLGRRTLHLTGLGGMFFSLLVLTVALALQESVNWIHYLGLVAVVVYIIFFNCGPGSIPWFITAELFEQNARAHTMGIANLVNWLANFAVGLLFPIMQKEMAYYAFVPFGVLLLAFWIFTYKKVPETKNRPTDEIVAQFKVAGV